MIIIIIFIIINVFDLKRYNIYRVRLQFVICRA